MKKLRENTRECLKSKKGSITVFSLILLASISAFVYNIGWVNIFTFLVDAKIFKISGLGMGLSGIVWSIQGLIVASLGHEKFDKGIYFRVLVRGIFYTPLLAFPIVYVFVHHTPKTIFETGVLIVVVTYMVRTIIKIDGKFMKLISVITKS